MEKRREGGRKRGRPGEPVPAAGLRARPRRGHSPSPPSRRPSAPQLPSRLRLPLSPVPAAPPRAPPPSPPRPVPFPVPPPGPRAYLGSQAGGGQQGAEQRESFPDLQERSGEAVSAGRPGAELPARRPLSPCCGRRAAPAGQEELRRRLPRLRLAAEGKGRAPPRPDPPARGSTPGPARPPPRGRLLPGPRPLPAAPRRCPRPSRRRPLGAPRRPRRPLKAAGG